MHEKLMKMMAKKRDLSPSEKKAKMDAVHEMRGAASELMGDKMDGLKKVSVMSNSKQGLNKGLDKAKQIVSDGQEDQMKLDASAPYSDYKHALSEHDGEEQSDELGRPMYEGGAAEMGYDDGGQVQDPNANPNLDPNKAQAFQDALKKSLHFNDGGEVESPNMDESEDGYSSREESEDSEDGSPADQDESREGNYDDQQDDSDDEFHGLDMDSLNEKLQKLMKMKQKMESKRS